MFLIAAHRKTLLTDALPNIDGHEASLSISYGEINLIIYYAMEELQRNGWENSIWCRIILSRKEIYVYN